MICSLFIFSLYSLGLFFGRCGCISAPSTEVDSGLRNTDARITIDLTSSLVKLTGQISFTNVGQKDITYYVVAAPPFLYQHIAWVGASQKVDSITKQLTATPVNVTGQSQRKLYRVTLPKPLKPGDKQTLNVEITGAHLLKPHPAEIWQSERQLVVFSGSAHLFSPYPTDSASLSLQLASANVISYSRQPEPSDKREAAIIYGPYKDLPPYSEAPIEVHFESEAPFLAVTTMERWIEVSHWGNVAVEEKVHLRHTGAVLRGGFSRFDYQRHPEGSGVNSVRGFRTVLPAAARDVYYRDEIGNISTSHMRVNVAEVELELQPRFPLFGGWKTFYMLGYNVPAHQYLFERGGYYLLRMRFVDHLFDEMLVDELYVRIVLPEGVQNVQFKDPGYAVERLPVEQHKTYLDTSGRTVLVFRKTSLVEQHIQEFEIRYTFNRALMLREPLMVVATFMLVFAVVIAVVRLDFSLTKDEAKEARERVALLVEQLQGLHDRIEALYQALRDAITRYKQHREIKKLNEERKGHDNTHKALIEQVTELQNKMKREGAITFVDKVAKLVTNDRLAWTLLAEACVLRAEKLVTEKLGREEYIDEENKVDEKLKELTSESDELLRSMSA